MSAGLKTTTVFGPSHSAEVPEVKGFGAGPATRMAVQPRVVLVMPRHLVIPLRAGWNIAAVIAHCKGRSAIGNRRAASDRTSDFTSMLGRTH